MNQNLTGMIRAIRYLRSSLSVVALVFVIILVLLIVVIIAPLEPIFKYALTGVLILLGIGVWICFWNKAKTEPLTVTEEYWIATLPYAYGSDEDERQRKEEFELPKVATRKLLPTPGKPDEKDAGKEH